MLRLVRLSFQHLGYGAEVGIPLLAEATDKWFAEELIEMYATFGAEADGFLADVPAMIVEACERTELLLANRIKVATDGPLLQKTARPAPKDTVPAADDARHQFPFGVGIADALPVNNGLSTSRKLRPKFIELFLDVRHLVQSDRSPSISLLTALAVALLNIAAEELGEQV